MKKFIFIGAMFLVALANWGCGSDEATTVSEAQGPFGTITYGGAQPELHPSNEPPPKKTLVRDVKVGEGPVARRGDTVLVFYIGANYRKKNSTYLFRWSPERPWEQQLNGKAAWEENIEGMKPGGLREIVVPSHLALGNGAIDYLVELVAVKSVA